MIQNLAELEEMNTNLDNYVVMSNDLIRNKSTLSLNEIKILRLAIMQIVKEDKDFKTYKVNITDLAKLLDIPSQNMYRDIQEMCKHLLQEIVYIGDGNPKHAWKMFQWCSNCEYENGVLTIRMHDSLKPHLIGLSKLYTQYVLGDILQLKSIYSIRIYELIKQSMRYSKVAGSEPITVYLGLDILRKATNTEEKYKQAGQWKAMLLDPALAEIDEKLRYHITPIPVKEGRKYIGFNFEIVSSIYYYATPEQKRKLIAAEERAKEMRKKAREKGVL